jgi:preprotein translocase subunit YajC
MSMNLFGATEAFAMAGNAGAQQGGRPGYEGIIMLVIMFAIFYFLLIRPQQKRAKQHKELVESLKVGDQVVTAGGMHGKVAAVQENVVTLGGRDRRQDQVQQIFDRLHHQAGAVRNLLK